MTLFKALCAGGPVGLFHVLRSARIARRMAHVQQCLRNEAEMHRSHTAALRFELGQLAMEQHNAEVRAAQFWRALS